MVELQKRAIQTQVKHNILEQYLFKWGIIINGGLKRLYQTISARGQQFRMRYVYVDCNAYIGRYKPEDESNNPVSGSPIIGIESLDKIASHAKNQIGFSPEVYTILFEEKNEYFQGLLETLELKGFNHRVRKTSQFSQLNSGDIAVIHGDYKDYLDSLLLFTGQNYTWSFYSLDPYGSQAIPLNVVSRIISQPYTDVMINMPYNDLHRKSGPAARNDPIFAQHTKYFDEMFGNKLWRQIAVEYFENSPEDRKDKMEGELVTYYTEQLQDVDSNLAIKTIRLKYPDMERTMFYLVLTTHDPTGAITLNEILDDAQLRQYELREAHRHIKKLGGQMSMFDEFAVQDNNAPSQDDIDIDVVADSIYELCKGISIEFREVLRRMADSPYHMSTIRKAMTKLKRSSKAKYSKLNNSEIVEFN